MKKSRHLKLKHYSDTKYTSRLHEYGHELCERGEQLVNYP